MFSKQFVVAMLLANVSANEVATQEEIKSAKLMQGVTNAFGANVTFEDMLECTKGNTKIA
jgi:hypothetical protein